MTMSEYYSYDGATAMTMTPMMTTMTTLKPMMVKMMVYLEMVASSLTPRDDDDDDDDIDFGMESLDSDVAVMAMATAAASGLENENANTLLNSQSVLLDFAFQRWVRNSNLNA